VDIFEKTLQKRDQMPHRKTLKNKSYYASTRWKSSVQIWPRLPL